MEFRGVWQGNFQPSHHSTTIFMPTAKIPFVLVFRELQHAERKSRAPPTSHRPGINLLTKKLKGSKNAFLTWMHSTSLSRTHAFIEGRLFIIAHNVEVLLSGGVVKQRKTILAQYNWFMSAPTLAKTQSHILYILFDTVIWRKCGSRLLGFSCLYGWSAWGTATPFCIPLSLCRISMQYAIVEGAHSRGCNLGERLSTV